MSISANTPITLLLPAQAVNVVLSALSKEPYVEVVGIINSIQQQVVAMQQPPTEVKTNE